MKRWIVLLLVVILMFSGCSQSKKLPEALPENFDNTGEKTVVYRGDRSFVRSYCVDGTQQIENGTYWFYELSDPYEKDWSENFYTYSLKDRELNGSVDYVGLKNCYATNGNWPLFLYPVHTEYSESNQSGVDAAVLAAAQKQFPSGTVPIVTDVWLCDMDGDNAQETLFMAKENQSGEMLLGYLKDEICQGLFSGKCEQITPMICDMNGDGKWELLLFTENDYKKFSVFDYTGGNFTQCYEILF